MRNQVVIRRSFWGNILLLLLCSAFVFAGIFIRQGGDAFYRFWGLLSIIFFGGGGLFYIIFAAWRPVAVISNEGIDVPLWRGSNFVRWRDVEKIEVVVQYAAGKHKYIGIFAPSATGIVGSGKTSQKITQGVTGWKEVPTLLINLSFTFVKIEKVMGILQEFHDRYKAAHGYPLETKP